MTTTFIIALLIILIFKECYFLKLCQTHICSDNNLGDLKKNRLFVQLSKFYFGLDAVDAESGIQMFY